MLLLYFFVLPNLLANKDVCDIQSLMSMVLGHLPLLQMIDTSSAWEQ